jgi:hypothetical protein
LLVEKRKVNRVGWSLEAALGGEKEARAQMNVWAEVHPRYVERFGPEAATIGPPEGIG